MTPEALLVAVDGARVVGAVIAGFDGWRGSMYRLGVVPELRRRGVGTRAGGGGPRAPAGGRAARRVGALVAPGEEDAVGLWEAAGYARDGGVARFVRNL